LLFTASKDHVPSVWWVEDGKRLGTYPGHKGTIWDLSCDRFSRRLLTASADTTCRLWDVKTGECLRSFTHTGPVRGVVWAEGGQKFATICDPFMDHSPKISVYEVPESQDPSSYSDEPVLVVDLPKPAAKRVVPTNILWTSMNEEILVAFDHGWIKLYDPETGDVKDEIQAHEKKINRVRFNMDKSLLITSSADFTSKLYDPVDWKHLKTYRTDRPVNDAVISDHKEHILLGGGQEAMSVTTTSGKVGKFETRFFHMVYELEFGTVKGHFGPINACKYKADREPLVPRPFCLYRRLTFLALLSSFVQWTLTRTEEAMPVEPRMDTFGCTSSIRITLTCRTLCLKSKKRAKTRATTRTRTKS
jgi:translation initiation factor 3 subunit I